MTLEKVNSDLNLFDRSNYGFCPSEARRKSGDIIAAKSMYCRKVGLNGCHKMPDLNTEDRCSFPVLNQQSMLFF